MRRKLLSITWAPRQSRWERGEGGRERRQVSPLTPGEAAGRLKRREGTVSSATAGAQTELGQVEAENAAR